VGERTSWSTSSRPSIVSTRPELTDDEFTAAKRHLLEK
jgi:hypothetical protein